MTITRFDDCVESSNWLPRLPDVGTIGRYIASYASYKTITATEMLAFVVFGKKVFLIFEDDGRPQSAAIGAANARSALTWLPKCGAPANAVIQYTADFDPGYNTAGVIAAFKAFRAGIGNYGLGAYADGYLCDQLWASKIITVRWLTCSTGFTGSRASRAAGRYELSQGLPTDILPGLNVDPDEVNPGNPLPDGFEFLPFGGKLPRGVPPNIVAVQGLLARVKGFDVVADGISGKLTQAAIKDYQNDNHFTADGVAGWNETLPKLAADAGFEVTDAAA